jgi:hypothetical protein
MGRVMEVTCRDVGNLTTRADGLDAQTWMIGKDFLGGVGNGRTSGKV